jgi:hypothetical protein
LEEEQVLQLLEQGEQRRRGLMKFPGLQVVQEVED